MMANYVSALKANFVLYDLPFEVLDHPKVKYFVKALKINRPLAITSHNVITILILIQISEPCGFRLLYRTDILLGFFAFMRLSNLAPMLWPYMMRQDILLVRTSYLPRIMQK